MSKQTTFFFIFGHLLMPTTAFPKKCLFISYSLTLSYPLQLSFFFSFMSLLPPSHGREFQGKIGLELAMFPSLVDCCESWRWRKFLRLDKADSTAFLLPRYLGETRLSYRCDKTKTLNSSTTYQVHTWGGPHQVWLALLPSRLLGQHGHVGDHEALKLGPLLLPAIIHWVVVGQGRSKQDLAAQEGALEVFRRQALVHVPVELRVSHGQL